MLWTKLIELPKAQLRELPHKRAASPPSPPHIVISPFSIARREDKGYELILCHWVNRHELQRATGKRKGLVLSRQEAQGAAMVSQWPIV